MPAARTPGIEILSEPPGSTGDNGNLLSHTTNTGTRTFTQFFGYDAASRLRMAVEKTTVSANLNGASTTCSSITDGTWPSGETCLRFGYDSFGNGWNEESRNASGLRFQGHNWYLIGSAVSNRIKDMEYDSAGNLRQLEPANPLSPVANYDGEGRIYEVGTRATSSPTATVTPTAQYYYNGEGQRVKRVAAGVTTYYVYGLDGAVAQEYTDGTVTATGRQYLIADHLGSTRLVLDGTTLQTVARYDYEPYGTLISRTGEGYSTAPGWSLFLFTGKERDMETAGSANPSGLDYFGARYYAAGQGRFSSPDQPLIDQSVLDPQSWNLYSYARNNPLSFVDPTGNAVCSYGDGPVPEERTASTEKECTDSGCKWIYQPTDTDDPNADASSFHFSITRTEFTDYLSASGQAVVDQLAKNADPSMALIATVAGGSAALGAGAALAPVAGQAINEIALGPAAGRVLYHYSRIAAAAQAGRLIDDTAAGRLLRALPLSPGLSTYGWHVLSRFWASGAGGTVNVFAEEGRRLGELYLTELPTLISNPFVQSIRYR